MDTSSVSNSQLNAAAAATTGGNNLVSVHETPILGKPKARRVTTTSKSEEGQTVSVLLEEYFDETLSFRLFEQHMPMRATTREVFEADGSLITSETERREANGQSTKIVIRGTGKSSTTRIMIGEVEARGTERMVLIETPKASYSYQPFEGKWSSFYKEINMKLEMKANFLKGPNATLNGPDGINLIFRNGRLTDLIVSQEHKSSNSTADGAIPGIID